ncbi:unnamed protein product [Symbiodinium natans]|uniref:L-lactate permease n=1 Tax=Symbiodinium natans TaxID=878477 RepID=A0A812I3E7_9DINO|nr:unnamed protein product [Symbiodinium natans]
MTLLPIAFLVAMVLKPKPMPTAKSPGAIFLFDCMESAHCLAWMKVQLRVITDSHPVAEVMLIGFCFAFVVEGASGFGTPAALAAPMLYSMGHPKMECVVCLLTFNTFMTIFGAVGTPVWFGIGEVLPDFGDENLMAVGFRASIAMSASAIILVPYVVQIIVPWSELRPSLLYVVLSTASVVVPFIVLAMFNYEFPSLAAGIVGLCITTALTLRGIGLGPHSHHQAAKTQDAPTEADCVEPVLEEPVAQERTLEQENTLKDLVDLEAPAAGVRFISGTIKVPVAEEDEAGQPKGTNSKKSLREKAKNNTLTIGRKAMKYLSNHAHLTVAPAKLHAAITEDEDGPPGELTVHVDDHHAERFHADVTVFDCVFRTMPLWLTVVLLILTRIEPIGLKSLLRQDEPEIVNGSLGTLGHLRISAVGRFSLTQILGTNLGWTYELLYIPFLLPFVVAGCASLLVFRKELETSPRTIVSGVAQRIKGPVVALSGALVLVELLRTGDALKVMTDTSGDFLLVDHWGRFVALSFPLGALGSFFSGSTTVSNLTFTQVQKVAADTLGISPTGLIGLSDGIWAERAEPSLFLFSASLCLPSQSCSRRVPSACRNREIGIGKPTWDEIRARFVDSPLCSSVRAEWQKLEGSATIAASECNSRKNKEKPERTLKALISFFPASSFAVHPVGMPSALRTSSQPRRSSACRCPRA